MKSWSFRIATFGGTEVRIHFTFFLLLLFYFWLGASQGGTAMALETMLLVGAVFTCVLLHEFGHVLAARRFGIQTPDITLLPIGGVARLERMPRNPWQELIVALCGPLVNVAIGLGIWFCLGFTNPRDADIDMSPTQGGFWSMLMVWNGFMVLFNMIPAFPMDGGRVLRALLAMFMDYGAATRAAASIGQTIAVLGFVAVLFWWHNPVLLIIALFIFMSAGQEASMVTQEETTRGLQVRHAMLTDFHKLTRGASLGDAVRLLLSGTQHDFPIVDGSGHFAGLLTRTALIGALAEHGPNHPVTDAMDKCEAALKPADPLNDAMALLRAAPCPALPVIDPENEQLIGLLTTENIGEMLMVRAALAQVA